MGRGDEPAFPIVTDGDPNVTCIFRGMTLREWFAGRALAGVLANPKYDWDRLEGNAIVHIARYTADALIAELEKDHG